MHDSVALPARARNEDTDGVNGVMLAELDQEVLDNLRDLPGDNDTDLLTELIDLFAQEAPPRITQIGQALQAADAKRVMQVAHSLKGSSANLGATVMAGLCNQLEEAGRKGTLDGCPALHLEVEREYGRVMLALHVERQATVR